MMTRMSQRATKIRAHFDGRNIVPDEPVSMPVGVPLELEWSISSKEETGPVSVKERLRRLDAATGRLSGPAIPLEALRRESLYEDRS